MDQQLPKQSYGAYTPGSLLNNKIQSALYTR